MNRILRMALYSLVIGVFAVGCGDDDDDGDGDTGPGSGAPPAEMIDTWVYQSVTVNSTAANLSVVLDWEAGAVAAKFHVFDSSAYSYEEVNASGGQLWGESGFVFIDGGEMDINLQFQNTMVVDEMTRVAWTLAGDVFTMRVLGGSDTVVFTLARE